MIPAFRLRMLAAAILFALPGCATTERVVTRTVEVKVPVPVPCRVDPVERPAFAVEALPAGASAFERLRALLVERQQRIAYESRLEAAISQCQ